MSAVDYATLASLDFEATGTNPLTARPCSVALVVEGPAYDGSDMFVAEWINAGVPIPAEASAVHGITVEQLLQAESRSSRVVIRAVLNALTLIAAARIPLVMFNACYDWPLLHMEAMRHGYEVPHGITIIDPMILDRSYDKYRKGPRTLTEVSQHHGVALTDAHSADADSWATLELARMVLHRHNLHQMPPAELHAHQITLYSAWRVNINSYWQRIGSPNEIRGTWPVGPMTAAHLMDSVGDRA